MDQVNWINSIMDSPAMRLQEQFSNRFNYLSSISQINRLVDASSRIPQIDSSLVKLVSSQKRMDSILQSCLSAQKHVSSFDMMLNVQASLASQVMRSIEYAIPYMDSDQQEEYAEDVLPKLQDCQDKKLTLSDILTIISLLVTIYFGIISSLPDEQLDRISQQNEIIIEQQEELIELKKEDAELRETLDALTDSINLLTDEVESLRNEIENLDDAPELDRQSDAEESEQQNDDPQNQAPAL